MVMGSKRRLNLIGKRSGKLVAVEEVGQDSRRNILWECQCDCGGIIIVAAWNLNNKHVRSCGCLRIDKAKRQILPNNGAAFNVVYKDYKRRAKRKNIPFDLTPKDFKGITQRTCFYCGAPPRNENKVKSGSYQYSGIDRIDSTGGYTPDNIISCCFQCNRMKGTIPQKEFKNHLLSILEHWII